MCPVHLFAQQTIYIDNLHYVRHYIRCAKDVKQGSDLMELTFAGEFQH